MSPTRTVPKSNEWWAAQFTRPLSIDINIKFAFIHWLYSLFHNVVLSILGFIGLCRSRPSSPLLTSYMYIGILFSPLRLNRVFLGGQDLYPPIQTLKVTRNNSRSQQYRRSPYDHITTIGYRTTITLQRVPRTKL